MTLRVGLHGPVNNAAYGIAGGLAAAGSDVRFVRSRETTLPIDQPVWQDGVFTLTTQEFAASASWDRARWEQFEQHVGWAAPPWLRDPAPHPGARYAPAPGTRPALRAALTALGARRPAWAALQQAWSDADLLVVSGSRPSLLAAGSGIPFVVWPHGSDARTTIRDFNANVRGVRSRSTAELEAALLKAAYGTATAIVTHDPLLTTGDRTGSAALERLARVRYLAWPVTSTDPLTRVQRRERLGTLLDRLGAPPAHGDLVALVASRIDYGFKGHDRLIQALTELGDTGIHYLLVSWGSDLAHARRALADAGLGDRVSLLPRIMSRPVVRELYASVDLSLDQFVWGTYGLAAIESMAAGTPVVMAVDDAAFEARGWEAPPALHARTPGDLVRVLSGVADGRVDLAAATARGRGWIDRRHSPAAVRGQLEAVADELLPQSGRASA